MRAGNRQLSLAVAPNPPLAVGSVHDDTLAGVPVRIYRPDASDPVPTIVFFHGGGFIVGDLDTHDNVARRLCRDLDAVVVSVGYRLAPEFPYPAAYDDCLTVTRHVADHTAGFGAGPLAVAGDSAGANLAAGVALAFRDEHRPLAAQLLAYPPTDLGGECPSLRENATGYVLTTAEVANDMLLYFADEPDAATRAPASPIFADSHRGLAPAVIGCGEFDPLRDEGLAYARALKDAGVDLFKRNYDDLTHAFLNFFGISQEPKPRRPSSPHNFASDSPGPTLRPIGRSQNAAKPASARWSGNLTGPEAASADFHRTGTANELSRQANSAACHQTARQQQTLSHTAAA
ncbi:acetyl esterase [Streptacidiphilus sp. BW17]|uniref:alpha/beta hydrolase n=1 Tax=Streptacidiphilus sp. BW17 TaxID=3156274 RepID=UPI0035152425